MYIYIYIYREIEGIYIYICMDYGSGLVGDKGICYMRNIFPYSPLITSKFQTSQIDSK